MEPLYLERYARPKDSWREVQDLANRYLAIKDLTDSETKHNESDLEQRQIVEEIMLATIPYISRLARELLYGEYDRKKEIHTGIPIDLGDGWIKLNPEVHEVEDLAQDGHMGVYTSFHTFKPEVAVSTWIRTNALGAMVRGAQNRGSVLRVPVHVYDNGGRRSLGNLALGDFESHEDFVEATSKLHYTRGSTTLGRRGAMALYVVGTGDYVESSDLSETASTNGRYAHPTDSSLSALDELCEEEIPEVVEAAVDGLGEMNAFLIRMLFEFPGWTRNGRPYSFSEIAKIYGQHVSMIQMQRDWNLGKLREELASLV